MKTLKFVSVVSKLIFATPTLGLPNSFVDLFLIFRLVKQKSLDYGPENVPVFARHSLSEKQQPGARRKINYFGLTSWFLLTQSIDQLDIFMSADWSTVQKPKTEFQAIVQLIVFSVESSTTVSTVLWDNYIAVPDFSPFAQFTES